MANKITQKSPITNLAFLTEHTGEPYLYGLPVFDGITYSSYRSAFVLLEKESVRTFLSANGIAPLKINRITENDLRDEKIYRYLAAMEIQDDFIKEKLLCPVLNTFLCPCKPLEPKDILALRHPYDVLHITDQITEKQGEVCEFEVLVETGEIRFSVWELKNK